MLEAAVSLLEQADLADVLSFLGTRAVAEAADVQPATVHHHFGNRDDGGKPNARLAATVLAVCLAPTPAEATVGEVGGIVGAAPDPSELGELPAAARQVLEQFLGARRSTVATLAGAAVAANDPTAQELLHEAYERIDGEFASTFTAVADYLGRRFDTDQGFDPQVLAVFAAALVDGLAMRHQFDPDRVEPELFGELVMRLFEAVTLPAEPDGAGEAVVERLMERRDRTDPGASLDPGKRARIVEATRSIYEERGITAVTVTSVAKAAGVSRSTVLANFGGRSGLAAAVWGRFVPELDRRLQADRARGIPLARTVERHLHRVVDLCRAARELTLVMLDGTIGETLRRGLVPGERSDDPGSPVPLTRMLAELLQEGADDLRPGVADTRRGALDLASTVTFLAMVRALIEPDEPASATVQYVMDLFFEGVLPRWEDPA